MNEFLILDTLVAAVCLGIAAQALASWLRLPAILPLLLLGMAFGPSGLGQFDPSSLGDVLETMIHLGVAIILFEGGLSLEPERLRKVGGSVRNLLTLGVVITGLLAAALAWAVIDMPVTTAVLFGAIVTVTGPTVIAPLLRHTIAPRSVKTILLSEGLIIDAIGALLAYLVLQWVESSGMPLQTLSGKVVQVTLVGAILGFVGGRLGAHVARSRRFNSELSNLIILSILMLVYGVAEHQAHQSGILASVVMGYTISAARLPDVGPLKAFKGQLTTLLISVLFILLAAQLDLTEIQKLGWKGVVVTAGLIFVIRPLSVFLSVMPWQLPLKERFFLAMTAPRGIVAAAVASLAARQLNAAGIEGGALLEGIVYLTILVTGAWATVMSLALPVILGYKNDAERRRAVLVGANPLSQLLGQLLKASGRTTVVVDSASWRLEQCRRLGMETVWGDARDASTYEEAGVEADTLVVAMTTNDELNLLVAELAHHEFDVEHPVVALQRPPDELGSRSRAWVDLLGGRDLNVPAWIKHLDNQRAHRVELPLKDKVTRARLRDLFAERPQDLRILSAWTSSGEPQLRVEGDDLKEAVSVSLLVLDGPARERVDEILATTEVELEEVTSEATSEKNGESTAGLASENIEGSIEVSHDDASGSDSKED
ncbi:MAG: cation:proton antiporter [Acidobacteriota bacterium]